MTVQSFEDILDAAKGRIEQSQIRTVEVEAFVDTGATYLCLPPSVIERLGLSLSHTRRVQTANGTVERRIFKGADVTVQGRTEQMSVMENDESTPPLIGYLVLEALDFVVDPKANQVIPNPAHEGKWIVDLYWAQCVAWPGSYGAGRTTDWNRDASRPGPADYPHWEGL